MFNGTMEYANNEIRLTILLLYTDTRMTRCTVLKNASANPVTPAMAHGSKDAEGRLLGPSAATQRGYLQDRAPGAFRTDRPPVRSPMRRPATAPLVHTAHEMRGVHKRVCIW